jgi:anti-sigma-K factor RskA
MIRCAVLMIAALATAAVASAGAGEQNGGCTQPLATATAAERSYANVNVRDFEGRVFIYVPDIVSSRGNFDAFQLWVVEGIYGRPFVQSSGSMDQTAFDRLRKSTNIRATPLSVRRTDESLRATIARQNYLLDVAVRVASSGADSVTARVCRAR